MNLPRHRRRGLIASLLLAHSIAGLSFAAVAAAEPLKFQIAAGNAAETLNVFSRQAKLQMFFEHTAVEGRRTQAVSGDLEPAAALALLLRESGLTFEFVNERTVSIRAAGAPSERATSDVRETSSWTASESAVGEKLQLAQVDTTERRAAEARQEEAAVSEKTQEIVVTGTNIKGLPKEYVASPVFTYTKDDMEQSGFGSLSEYIQSIPQNFTGDASEYATTGVAFGQGIGGALSNNQFDGFASFSLRGLGSDATITLLNGRRMPSAGMVEVPTVSFIPSAVIERMDIVPDGASATYGADAVGGVVNLITRRSFDGIELRMRGSSATEVDRDEYQMSAAAGHSWSGGNIFGTLSYQDREPMVGDAQPLPSGTYEIAATPDEALMSFFGGISQDVGQVSLSLEGSYFESDRTAFQITLPSNDRRFLTRSHGHSLYSSANWRVSDSTSFDLTVDYHENETYSATRRMGTLLAARTYTNRLFVAEGRGQTALFRLPGGTAQLAGGLQYRRETLGTDAVIFFRGAGGEHEVSSVFAETFLPLVGPEQNIPLMRALTLSAALRYEDFGSPIGSATAPKVGLRWNMTESVSLRSTFSQSFLVPRLRNTAGIAEQVSFQAQPDAFQNSQDPRLPAGQSLVFFRAGSNPDLVSQDADTFTVGFDFTPRALEGFSFGAGYYRVEFTNRIANPLVTDILSNSAFSIFSTRPPQSGQILAALSNPAVSRIYVTGIPFINGGATTFYATPADVPASLIASAQLVADVRTQNFSKEITDGIDFEVSYRRPLLGGDMSFKLGGQYILTLERKTPGTGVAISRVDTIFNPVDLTMNGNIGWRRGRFSIGSSLDYVDGYVDNRTGQNNLAIGSYQTASLSLGWENGPDEGMFGLRDSSFRLVVANVFDKQPPTIQNEVLPFDPYNVPVNPRSVALIITKRLGR